MKKHTIIALHALLGVAMLLASSCNSGSMRSNPGKIYAPDMTYSQAYESYSTNPNFSNGLTNRSLVSGTIAIDAEFPDHLTEADSTSYYALTSNHKFNAAEMTESKRLFDIYCGICHGQNLDGQGPLYTSGAFAAMPANLKDAKYLNMSVGQIYYAIMYGKNMMGSYAAQLDKKQRWMVIAYIKKMQSENGGAAFTMGTDEIEKGGVDSNQVVADTASVAKK